MDQKNSAYQSAVECPLILLLGGVSYYLLELIWRGYSHPSMALCGAFCLWQLWRIERDRAALPLPLRALMGAVVITLVELFAGSLLNLGLGLEVWDYSSLPFHFLGQICLPYSILWFFLCFPVIAGLGLLRRAVFPEHG